MSTGPSIQQGEDDFPEREGAESQSARAAPEAWLDRLKALWQSFQNWQERLLTSFKATASQWQARVRTQWQAEEAKAEEGVRQARRSLQLAAWAPVSVLSALLGAGLTAVLVVWMSSIWWDYSASTGRVLLVVTAVVTPVALMIWFASEPRVATTWRRLWLLLGFQVLVLGLGALYLAVDKSVSLFRP